MRALVLVALCTIVGTIAGTTVGTTAAYAQVPGAVQAGAQSAPPVSVPAPSLEQDADGRRIIRGCAPGESCARPEDVLREFETEAFPAPGASPWIDERAPVPSRLENGATSRRVSRPSELRPDQPWLDKLTMPDLPVRWTPRLVDYLLFYKNDPRGRSIMAAWLTSQGRYRDMMITQLRKAKLPEDLLYVSMIESSYDPSTASGAGAAGLWQFMPDGGRIYGLRQDRWVDERRDPLRSTLAAIDYWSDLHQRFGDWDTAMAAYNVGYGGMLRAIARYNTNDFYQLCELENAVPWETCLYPPKVLAVAIVGHNRGVFGFDTLKEAAPESWDEVAVPTSVPISMIARAAGANDAEIKRLNPHLRRDRTPPGETSYVVRVPRGSKADFARKLADLQTDWDGYDAYVVAHGERLEDIATTYGISLAKLRAMNDIGREAEIGGGTVLVVPRVAPDVREKNKAKAKAKLVASGVDHKDGDDSLLVPVPDKDLVVANRQRVFYRVVSGDTVRSVGKAFGVTTEQLNAWNALDKDAKLHPKMVLQVFVEQDFDADKRKVALLDPSTLTVVSRGSTEHLDIAEGLVGRVRTEYISKGNEKLADVAKRYGMGSHDLARINRISFNTVLAKDQKIIVYQVIDPTRSERAEEQWRKTPKARRPKRTSQKAQGPITRPTEVD